MPALDGGGVERGTVEISRALVERGHRSIVISTGGRLTDELAAHGAEHISMDLGRKSPRTFLKIRPLRAWAASEKVDVLHPRSRLPAWITFLAWRRMAPATRPHFITSVHGLHSVSRYSQITTAGERVEVVSQAAQQYTLQHYPQTDAGKLVLIPRGVDPALFPHNHQPTDRWTQEWFLRFPHLRNKFVIALPGRLTRLKGHYDFLDILDHLKNSPHSFHGLIVGGEDPKRQAYADQLRQAVAQRGLTDYVTFTGHRTDVRDVLACCNAAVSLSTKPESFGRAVLESVALGVPTLGYDHGGVGEVLARVYPAGRIAKGDTAAAAHALMALAQGDTAPPLADPTLNGLTLQAMCDRTLAMYESVAAEPQGS
ncbi:MAG: glycosyltransferase [Algisphaera sp.]